MKISELVKEITEAAEEKFNVGDCADGAISVCMYWSGENWQVWLERPSQNALSRGEVPYEQWRTVRLIENECRFCLMADSLTDGLKELLNEVNSATDWDE